MATGNQHNGGTSDISILSSFDSLEILPVPILVVDSMFRIAFANRCFGDLLELRREELECSPLAQHISARDPISVIGVDRILKEAEFTVSLRTRDCSIVDLCCSPTPVELADESVGRLLVFHDSKRLRTAIIEEERAVLLASERAQELEKARVDLQNANRQIAHFETLMEEHLEVRTSMLKKEMAEAVCLRQRAEFQAKRLMELEEKKN